MILLMNLGDFQATFAKKPHKACGSADVSVGICIYGLMRTEQWSKQNFVQMTCNWSVHRGFKMMLKSFLHDGVYQVLAIKETIDVLTLLGSTVITCGHFDSHEWFRNIQRYSMISSFLGNNPSICELCLYSFRPFLQRNGTPGHRLITEMFTLTSGVRTIPDASLSCQHLDNPLKRSWVVLLFFFGGFLSNHRGGLHTKMCQGRSSVEAYAGCPIGKNATLKGYKSKRHSICPCLSHPAVTYRHGRPWKVSEHCPSKDSSRNISRQFQAYVTLQYVYISKGLALFLWLYPGVLGTHIWPQSHSIPNLIGWHCSGAKKRHHIDIQQPVVFGETAGRDSLWWKPGACRLCLSTSKTMMFRVLMESSRE